MVFAFDRPDLDIGDNARRAARAELDLAIAEVGETGFEVHDTVRNVRRRLKRVRSLLRLIRPVFPDFEAENAALRETGAEVAALRDARALVEAVDQLGRGAPPSLIVPIAHWRALLAARAADHESGLERETFLLELRGKLRDARVRSELWELTGTGTASIVPGLAATYSKARRSYRAAARAPDDDARFHEWRKWVKHHWGHLKLLRGLMPSFVDERRERAGRLATMLGDVQNLSILRAHLDSAPAEAGRVREELARRLERLRRRSLKAGKRLFDEPPKVVRRRWKAYFRDWRAARRLAR
jgi:hypothetical protein